MTRLYYIHDPMCSWCYGFNRTLEDLISKLPSDVQFQKVLGGLAADSNTPMPLALQQQIQAGWRRIEARMPWVRFNFDFWTQTTPIRSTYPACRAVLAAATFGSDYAEQMTQKIQQQYYQAAQNPALDSVLLAAAVALGLDANAFSLVYHSPEIEQALQAELTLRDKLGVSSYPSLRLQTASGSIWPLGLDYSDAAIMLEEMQVLIAMD